MSETQPPRNSPPDVGVVKYGLTENEIKKHSQELGWMGKVFGSNENSPINLAGMLIILCVLGMIVAPAYTYPPAFSLGDLEKLFGGFIGAAIAFVGGYVGGKKA